MAERLDHLLVRRGLVPSRSRAQALIQAGAVRVEGVVVLRPAARVAAAAAVEIGADPVPYASRAGLKLAHGLDVFGFDPTGRQALDLGASTGGFTDVLLARGAARVVAVDVGQGQMLPRLAADARVRLFEGLHARDLTAAQAGRVQAITADLSFIALAKAIGPALALAEPGAWAVLLVKPQFEVGRAGVGKGGIVRDPAAIAQAVAGVRAFVAARGWQPVAETDSPIPGGDGNREVLLGAVKPA